MIIYRRLSRFPLPFGFLGDSALLFSDYARVFFSSEFSRFNASRIFVYSEMSFSPLITFLLGWILIRLARDAYFKVFSVSSKHPADGLIFAIMIVREFPPRLSLRRRVSLEALNGI